MLLLGYIYTLFQLIILSRWTGPHIWTSSLCGGRVYESACAALGIVFAFFSKMCHSSQPPHIDQMATTRLEEMIDEEDIFPEQQKPN